MICSVIIPSRKRFNMLKACVSSVFESVTNRDNIDVIVRLHSDDYESLDRKQELLDSGSVTIIGGAPGLEYHTHGSSFMEAVPFAKGDWIFSPPDDSVIQGRGWDEVLKTVPKFGWVCAPEGLINGGSSYKRCDMHPTPIAPRDCGLFETKTFAFPHDVFIWEQLRGRGWKTRFLQGMTLNHFNHTHVTD